ncbi:MAG: MmgE/PrpD family protein [Candidatus Nanopelagicales bacterium]|nr:MmgE/PrpD family protein [Candidatus Nanopelagicales bacterium]
MNLWDSWQLGLYRRVDSLVDPEASVDESTRNRAALVMVDDLAAMVAAIDEPELLALSASSPRVSPGVECLHVNGAKSGRSWAAFVNAVAANWHELDEGYRPVPCHGGLYTLPAVMAEVQAAAGSINDVYRGLVCGYEVVTAYSRLFPAPRPLALHPHASVSAMGAAAGVAAARGPLGPGVETSVSIASTLGALGPFSHATEGKLVRNAWAGQGAVSGFHAVELAQAGIYGGVNSPADVLCGVLGYQLDQFELENPWDRWAIHDGYHKSYACCQYAHSAVEAVAQLVAGPLAEIRHSDISAIEVQTHPLAMPLDDPVPTTVLGAKFSVPHTVAAVLVTKSTQADTFSDLLVSDAEVDRLRRLVRMSAFEGNLEPPHDRPARVRVTLKDGRIFSAECWSAIGGPDRPMNADQVMEKAEFLVGSRMPRFMQNAQDLVNGHVDQQRPFGDFLSTMWTQS